MTHKENRTSHGPLFHAPIFGLDGQEIMTVTDDGGDFITLFTEDEEQPGKLNPTIINRRDYQQLLKDQPRKK